MSALRVYVAGASAEVDMVAGYIERLRDAGVFITHDWTADVKSAVARGMTTTGLTDAQRQAFGATDLAGVSVAELMWLLAPTGASVDAWTELGVAIGVGTPLIISGDGARRSIFTEGRHCVATHEEAFAHIVERAAAQRSAA